MNTDQMIVCCDCGATFAFTKTEQQFFAEKNFRPPKRCMPCRRVVRARHDAMDAGQVRPFDR